MPQLSRRAVWFSRFLALVFLFTVVGASASVLAPRLAAAQQQQDEDEDQAAQPANQIVNVELILDSSGSMSEATSTGEPRIDAAKRVLNEVIDVIPEDRGEQLNVGFRVFGHRGDNTDAGREESCASTELRVPIQGVNKDALRAEVEQYQPVGWTPIALSLQQAAADFPDDAENITNAIILVTDGLETCAEPQETCNAAAALFTGPKVVTVNVVGLGLAEDELAILQCIADNGGGRLVGAQNAAELSAALFTFLEELEVVVRNGFLEIEVIGGLWPRATVEGETGATDANPEGQPFTLEMTEPRVELAIGLYDVFWINPSGQETRIQVNIEAERTTLIRGSVIEFPQGAGEIYTVKDLAGVVIWQDQFELGDRVWVLPGIYRIELLEVVGDPILLYADIQTLPGTVTNLRVYTAP
jgi:Mg-chelatase subunit ChlD